MWKTQKFSPLKMLDNKCFSLFGGELPTFSTFQNVEKLKIDKISHIS